MNNEYKEFLIECIKSRRYLEFSYKDMSNCLINVSVDDYIDFEKGKYLMSKENLKRIMRVLCIKRPQEINIEDYINTDDLNEEEINDLSNVLSVIVGDDNA